MGLMKVDNGTGATVTRRKARDRSYRRPFNMKVALDRVPLRANDDALGR